MRRPYTSVPDCPNCGSARTGRYISGNGFTSSATIEKGFLKKGELVRVSAIPLSEREANLFCDDCGIEWPGKTETVWLTSQEIREMKECSGINKELLDKYRQKRRKGGFLKNFIGDLIENLRKKKEED